MDYSINPSVLGKMTAIPGSICDYLFEASGDAIKVLLLIFGSGELKSTNEIASSLNMSENQVNDCIRYWISKGVFLAPEAEKKANINVKKPDSSSITTDEIISAKENDSDTSLLFSQAEELYRRPLKPAEARNLLYILEITALPVDVILMALDFSIRIGKSTARYILKVCEDWDDKNIITHEQAEVQIQKMMEKNDRERLVCGCFGIHNRALSVNEKKAIEKWFCEYGFSIKMVQYAYEKTIDNTGKLSFPYISKILSTWYKSKFTTPEEVDKGESPKKKNQKTSENEPSYDLDELSKRGLFIPEIPE